MGGDAHGGVLEHVGHDEEADHAAADVDLVQLRNAAVAAGDSDVPERDIEVILRCVRRGRGAGGGRADEYVLVFVRARTYLLRACRGRAGLF